MAFDPAVLRVNYNYSRKSLADILSIPSIATSREGLFRASDWLLLFVTLDKEAAEVGVKYNDYFEDGAFYWESQNQQSLSSPIIQKIIGGKVTPLLFVREHAKIRGDTQEFVYAGQLEYLEHAPNSSNPVKLAFATPEITMPILPPLQSLVAWKPTGAHALGVPATLLKKSKKKLIARLATGQGFELDPVVRRAIELLAMEKARRFYEIRGYAVRDVSGQQPYDLLCEKNGMKSRRVEVKGTRGDGSTIILTGNEVRAALEASSITDLLICHSVQLDQTGEKPKAQGGKLKLIQNWKPDWASLVATEYRYVLPTGRGPQDK